MGFYETLSPVQLAGIQAVAMDMWSPYVNATLECFPSAARKIVFDRFSFMPPILRENAHDHNFPTKNPEEPWVYSQIEDFFDPAGDRMYVQTDDGIVAYPIAPERRSGRTLQALLDRYFL